MKLTECKAYLRQHGGNGRTRVQMTHRCLLANSGNILKRLLVALFSLVSFVCRNQKWNSIGTNTLKTVHLVQGRPSYLPLSLPVASLLLWLSSWPPALSVAAQYSAVSIFYWSVNRRSYSHEHVVKTKTQIRPCQHVHKYFLKQSFSFFIVALYIHT